MSRLNRASVFAAALEILETAGSAALTIPALARKLRIQPPSLYNHIDSISDLKRELSIHSMKLADEVRRTATRGKSRDEAVFATAQACRRFASEHPALYALSVAVPPENDREWFEAFSQFRLHWMSVLEDYRIEPLQRRFVARGMRSMVHGFVDLELNGGWLDDVVADESFEGSMQLILKGLHALEERTEKAARQGSVFSWKN